MTSKRASSEQDRSAEAGGGAMSDDIEGSGEQTRIIAGLGRSLLPASSNKLESWLSQGHTKRPINRQLLRAFGAREHSVQLLAARQGAHSRHGADARGLARARVAVRGEVQRHREEPRV